MQLREDFPDSANPEAECEAIYISWKKQDEFEKMRPARLNNYQNKLLAIFYKCRKYADEMRSIPLEILKEFSSCNFCEQDICQFIVSGIDDHFLTLCGAKMKRDIENMKSKGGHQ